MVDELKNPVNIARQKLAKAFGVEESWQQITITPDGTDRASIGGFPPQVLAAFSGTNTSHGLEKRKALRNALTAAIGGSIDCAYAPEGGKFTGPVLVNKANFDNAVTDISNLGPDQIEALRAALANVAKMEYRKRGLE